MPWWAVLYLLLLGALELGAARLRRQLGVSRTAVWLDVATMAAWALLMTAYFDAELARALGRVAAPLFVGALLWTGISAHHDIALFESHPELPPEARDAASYVGILLTALLLAPAVGLGALAALRAW